MSKILFLLLIFISVPTVVNAGILPPCTATGNCSFCDMLFTVNAIMRWIIYVAGSAALLFFIWGGFKFILARGDSGKIKSAQAILSNTILGVVVVSLAWTGINLIISKTAGDTNKVIIFSDKDRVEWYNLCVKSSSGDECADKGDGFPCANFTKHCERGVCVEKSACEWLASQSGYNIAAGFDYQCREPEKIRSICGIEYNQCDTSPYCIKNLCSDTIKGTTVCCSPPPKEKEK